MLQEWASKPELSANIDAQRKNIQCMKPCSKANNYTSGIVQCCTPFHLHCDLINKSYSTNLWRVCQSQLTYAASCLHTTPSIFQEEKDAPQTGNCPPQNGAATTSLIAQAVQAVQIILKREAKNKTVIELPDEELNLGLRRVVNCLTSRNTNHYTIWDGALFGDDSRGISIVYIDAMTRIGISMHGHILSRLHYSSVSLSGRLHILHIWSACQMTPLLIRPQ